MKIANIAHQPLTSEPETIKPTSSDRPSAETAGEKLEEAAVANKSSLPAFQKPPVDDPLSKAFLLDKLGAGNSGTAPSGPEIRMKDNNVDWSDDPGSDLPGEDRVSDATEKDPNGSGRDVGFDLSAPSRFEGDGHTKATGGQASGTTTNSTDTQSNTTSSSSTQSSTTGSTSVHKKK